MWRNASAFGGVSQLAPTAASVAPPPAAPSPSLLAAADSLEVRLLRLARGACRTTCTRTV